MLSKLYMYEFRYNYIKKRSGAKSLFTNTGSLNYKIKKEGDIYEIFDKDKDLFDFSNYPKGLSFMILLN